MKKVIQVSVGIPAYNEEKNIAHLLKNILSQKQEGWKLKEIVVCSDGSTDRTDKRVLSIKSPLVTLLHDGERKGKAKRVQQIYQKLSGEIFVMFDGDVRVLSKHTITHVVKPFMEDKITMLVGANSIALSPTTFFQRGVYATFKVFYATRLHIRNGNNLFACTGSCVGIRGSFAKSIKFPKIKNEDTYLFFLCRSKKYRFAFAKNAIIYYKLPRVLSDYLSQIFRSDPEAVNMSLEKYFGDLVAQEYKRGLAFYAKNVFKVFLEDPLPVLYIICVNVLCKPFFKFIANPNKLTWEAVKSTKVL